MGAIFLEQAIAVKTTPYTLPDAKTEISPQANFSFAISIGSDTFTLNPVDGGGYDFAPKGGAPIHSLLLMEVPRVYRTDLEGDGDLDIVLLSGSLAVELVNGEKGLQTGKDQVTLGPTNVTGDLATDQILAAIKLTDPAKRKQICLPIVLNRNVSAHTRNMAGACLGAGLEALDPIFTAAARDSNIEDFDRIGAATHLSTPIKQDLSLLAIVGDPAVEASAQLSATQFIRNPFKRDEALLSIAQNKRLSVHQRLMALQKITLPLEVKGSILAICKELLGEGQLTVEEKDEIQKIILRVALP